MRQENPARGISVVPNINENRSHILIVDDEAGIRDVPIDILKIDQSFVRDLSTDPDDAAVVMAIITLAPQSRIECDCRGSRNRRTTETLAFAQMRWRAGLLISEANAC